MKLSVILILSVLCYISLSAKLYKQKEFNQSLKIWKSIKPCSYTYLTSWKSWTLFETHTTIRVSKDKVVRREFESWYYERGTYERVDVESWVESTPSEIGSHESGAPLKTIDQLYKQCKEEILIQDPAQNTMYFELFDNGVLKKCGYFPNNCADDCFTGISLDDLILS